MKRFPYEGGHRVPGIVRLPGVIPSGTQSDKLFNGTDIFPTICKSVGVPLPAGITIDGEANFNAFVNKGIKRNTPAIWFYPHHGDTYSRMPQMSMRSEQYTLIGWLPEKPDSMDLNKWFYTNVAVKFELYDILKDPWQKHNLAGKNPEKVDSLSGIMEKLWIDMRNEGLKK